MIRSNVPVEIKTHQELATDNNAARKAICPKHHVHQK
jgi:hypothetical protein